MSHTPIALMIFTACAAAGCASETEGSDDAVAMAEAALTVPDAKAGTGCLATHANAGGVADPYLRIDFVRPDRVDLSTYTREGRRTATTRDGTYAVNKRADGSLELTASGTFAAPVGTLRRTASGYTFTTAAGLPSAMGWWMRTTGVATCELARPEAFPPLPNPTALAAPQIVASDFGFADPLPKTVCRATALSADGARLEIVLEPSRVSTGGGWGTRFAGYADVYLFDEKGYGRMVRWMADVSRGFSASRLTLKDLGDVKTTYEGGGTYRLVFDPASAARDVLGRDPVPLRCE